MRRRTVIQWLLAAVSSLPLGPASAKASARKRLRPEARARRPQRPSPAELDLLRALAPAVLPTALGAPAIDRAVDDFIRWLRDYRPGADLEHGYGFPRLQATPESPAARYPGQLAALERAARAEGSSFAALPLEARRRIVVAVLTRAGIDELPVRPDGRHVAADLMSHFFRSSAANDLCYEAAIRRDDCRGLPGSEDPPPPITVTPNPQPRIPNP